MKKSSRMSAEIIERIIKNNSLAEQARLCPWGCSSDAGVRMYPGREKTADNENIRASFFRDTDRIIHSQAYARYIDKTQVFYLFENDHITHRVLHVQFVSKIGRVIGRALRLNEDLIEAIALGHDLGHVPYGHDGEKILDLLCHRHGLGSFCHNAQSVRFLHQIEKNGQGLNLTMQVLDGILCHNGEIFDRVYRPDFNKSVQAYLREYQQCFDDAGASRKIYPMTLEGCLARICDIIAYIGRDIEDAITVRLITRTDIPAGIRRVLGDNNDAIINTLVTDLIHNSFDKPYLAFSKDIFLALKDLRQFNYNRIYFNPRIKVHAVKVDTMFTMLFDVYCKQMQLRQKDSFMYRYWRRMSAHYRKTTHQKRAVVDFIAGMTDDFFNNQFKSLFVPQSYGYVFPARQRH